MQGEDNYVITISNTEAEVIKKFVSIFYEKYNLLLR